MDRWIEGAGKTYTKIPRGKKITHSTNTVKVINIQDFKLQL